MKEHLVPPDRGHKAGVVLVEANLRKSGTESDTCSIVLRPAPLKRRRKAKAKEGAPEPMSETMPSVSLPGASSSQGLAPVAGVTASSSQGQGLAPVAGVTVTSSSSLGQGLGPVAGVTASGLQATPMKVGKTQGKRIFL